jgi:hypothetical protein
MRPWWLVILLAACGSSAHRARPPARTPYLMLFEQGKTFTLPAIQTSSTGPASSGTASCTVAAVKPVADATVSRIACAAPHQGLLIAGTWVATPAGLYHPYLPVDDPDELTLLGDDDLLVATLPAERDHDHTTGPTHESIEAFEHESSWCVQHTTKAGSDRRRFALCFDGATVTGASDFVGTAAGWQRVELGAAPHGDDDDDDDDD